MSKLFSRLSEIALQFHHLAFAGVGVHDRIGGLRPTQRAEGDVNVAKNSHLLAPRAGAQGHHAATAPANQNSPLKLADLAIGPQRV